MQRPPIHIQPLNRIKPLQQPHNNIARLRQRKLLPDTNPWPAIKRQILPPNLPAFPPLRPERRRIRAPDVRPPVHDVHAVTNFCPLRYEDRATAVGPAAQREGGINCRAARVQRDHGLQAEGFVERVLQECAGFEAREGDVVGVAGVVVAEFLDDDAAQLVEGLGVLCEEAEEPGE